MGTDHTRNICSCLLRSIFTSWLPPTSTVLYIDIKGLKYIVSSCVSSCNQPYHVCFDLFNRDMETVLREDREALRSMQKHQPRFSEEQKRELSQVHPWIRTGRLPRAINISVSRLQLDQNRTYKDRNMTSLAEVINHWNRLDLTFFSGF